ncbi:hypothetical protein P3342_007027 [Pyrenophora teres f. teres]|nr:hypothetical protein P3342_007027 [Pyrenophora teres f. teres]
MQLSLDLADLAQSAGIDEAFGQPRIRVFEYISVTRSLRCPLPASFTTASGVEGFAFFDSAVYSVPIHPRTSANFASQWTRLHLHNSPSTYHNHAILRLAQSAPWTLSARVVISDLTPSTWAN